jgi:hypothetical protein
MRRTFFSILLTALTWGMLWPTQAMAQEGKGTITGTVKDSTDSPLPGALVELQPLGNRVVSDTQGQFRITSLPPGQYNLTFSYLGFEAFTATAKIEAGQTTNVDAV